MIRDDNDVPLFIDDLYMPEEVARVFRVSIKTLERWRENHTGPPCYKLPNGEIRYWGDECNTWFAQRKYRTCEESNDKQPEQDE